MKYLWILPLVVALGIVIFWINQPDESSPTADRSTEEPDQTSDQYATSSLSLPIDEFFERITQKPFGIYITPSTSPIQPERFTGYHTAVDVEYGDVSDRVEVSSVADGTVVMSRTVTGYGGVLVIDHRPQFDWYSLYGHLDPASLPGTGTSIKQGQTVGWLAAAFTPKSGGERKHLHFGIISQDSPNIAGYVAQKSQLSGWIDPAILFKQNSL